MADKVQFGICNVTIFSRSVGANDAVSYTKVCDWKGAVNLNLSAQVEENVFYADNSKYWISNKSQGYEGELEVALVPDEVKTTFLGYVEASNDNLVETDAAGAEFGLVYQFETDIESRRVILYNCTMGRPDEEHGTTEDSTEPNTITVPFNVNGEVVTNNNTDLRCFQSVVHKADANYASCLTTMALPTF